MEILCSWIRRLYIKMSIRKVFYRFKEIHIKTPIDFFCRNGKANPQIDMELQWPQIASIEKEETVGKTHTSRIENLLQSYSKQYIMWNRHADK